MTHSTIVTALADWDPNRSSMKVLFMICMFDFGFISHVLSDTALCIFLDLRLANQTTGFIEVTHSTWQCYLKNNEYCILFRVLGFLVIYCLLLIVFLKYFCNDSIGIRKTVFFFSDLLIGHWGLLLDWRSVCQAKMMFIIKNIYIIVKLKKRNRNSDTSEQWLKVK